MTVKELQDRMDKSEFDCWRVRLQEEVHDFHRNDHLVAMLAHQIYLLRVAMVGVKKGTKFLTVDDFLVKFEVRGKGKKAETKSKDDAIREKSMADAAALMKSLGLNPKTGQHRLDKRTGKPVMAGRVKRPPVPKKGRTHASRGSDRPLRGGRPGGGKGR